MPSRIARRPAPGTRAAAAATVIALVIVSGSAVPSAGGEPTALRDDLRRPLETPVRILTPFDRPDTRWAPGHRGVDLAAAPHSRVLAPADGTVGFAGPVGGRTVVSVDHGDGLRTTYEPVRALVTAGDEVLVGQVIGHVLGGHPTCPGDVCLHWGARVASGGPPRDDDYVDPLTLLRPDDGPIRLKPLEPGDATR